MRIATVEVGIVNVPLEGRFTTAHGAVKTQRSVLVKVLGEGGVSGWGCVDPIPGYSAMTPEEVDRAVSEILGPALLGGDPLNILGALHRMDACLPDGFEAKAAVEMALVDLKGKVLGASAGSLLGGRLREAVALNAWIGVESPERATRLAAWWSERGFQSAKIKVGGEFREDVDRVAAVRAAVGRQMQLRVDANEALTVDGAIRFAKALEPYEVSLLEQPVPRDDLAGLAEVRRRSPLSIMADESVQGPSSLVEIIRLQAADLVKLKVMKQGGMLRTFQMASMAEVAGLRVVIGHGFGLWVSTLAEVHVAAASSAIVDGCESVGPLKMSGDVVKDPPSIEGGRLLVPSAPGLGAEPDEGLLDKFGWGSVTSERA